MNLEKDEVSLVQGIKSGDEESFKKLVVNYEQQVFRLCLGYIKNNEEAEDLAQEVFMEVYESINSYKNESDLGTWIYRITVNKSLEKIRYYKRSKRFAWITSLFGNEEKYSSFSKDWVHPGVKMENIERSKVLYEAIEKLPENQHAAFIMHKIEGMTYKEIADILKLNLSTVESLMHRAKTNLKKTLKHYYKSGL